MVLSSNRWSKRFATIELSVGAEVCFEEVWVQKIGEKEVRSIRSRLCRQNGSSVGGIDLFLSKLEKVLKEKWFRSKRSC